MTAVAGTRVAELCGTAPFTGFHWCNYGLAPEREAALVDAGLVVSARAPGRGCRGRRAARPPVLRRDALPAPGGKLELGQLHPLIAALVSAAAVPAVEIAYPVESSISGGRWPGAVAGRSSSATRASKYA